MGFFDHLQKKGTAVIQPQKTRIVKVESKYRTKTTPSGSGPSRYGSHTSQPLTAVAQRLSSLSDPTSSRTTTSKSGATSKPLVRKRRSKVHRFTLSSCSSEADSDTDASLSIHKRARVSPSADVDVERRLRFDAAEVLGENQQQFLMVHAADITIREKSTEFTPAFEQKAEPACVQLAYPGGTQKERYRLVVPREKDGFKPLDDIMQVVEEVSHNYIPCEQIHIFNDESSGLRRRLRRALIRGSLSDFRSSIDEYNETVERLRRDGIIAKHLDGMHSPSLSLVERILTQVYARTVSPRVESLRRYENGTDNVYGELLPRFISEIFKETRLKSNQIFVDLGSGVGNVVLQAALEIGCESWGCEMMQNACDLADLQEAEFKARCRLWGLATGGVHLIRGDFLKEEKIGEVLRKADVVLINNQAFTPQLNNSLVNYFLDMKEGCQIVSLKSFVSQGHKIQSRNLNSAINLLTVRQKNYWSNCVSWTDTGGTYFIASKDSSRLRAFSEGSPMNGG